MVIVDIFPSQLKIHAKRNHMTQDHVRVNVFYFLLSFMQIPLCFNP